MKRRLIAFLLAAILGAGLTGCGAKDTTHNDNDVLGDEYTTPGDVIDDALDGEGDDAKQSKKSDNKDDTQGVLEGDASDTTNPANDAMGTSATGVVSYQQMLRNGFVHDRDGILTDGENSHS